MTDAAPSPTAAPAAPPMPDNSKVLAIQRTIDIADTAQVTSFGERAQRNVAGFADQILNQTKNRELGDTASCSATSSARRAGSTRRSCKSRARSGGCSAAPAAVHVFRSKFETVAAQIDRITVELERRVDRLRRDVTMLDGLHDQTKASIVELDSYIAAGKAFAETFRRETLPDLHVKAMAGESGSADMMAAQTYQDALQAVDRLEKRVLYLQQARQIAIQQLPQIRIVQNGDATLIESLQASVNLTIPAWKQKMVLLLGLTHQQDALAMQKTVTDATNEMLRGASEMMKGQAIEIEQQSQRGIVDIETLAKTNQDLIDTISGVMAAQAEGRRKRALVEQEMERQTSELKRVLTLAPAAGVRSGGRARRGGASFGANAGGR
jgi:uncharacterized protein YaaN involved in tellurite resistance